MRNQVAWIGCLVILFATEFCSGQSGVRATASAADIQGKVTVDMTINRTFGTHPVRDLTLHLLKVEDARPLQELQIKCRSAVSKPKADPVAAYQLCSKGLAEAVELVPRLPLAATTRTDREGFYRFDGVETGKQYQVVGVKVEDGTPIVIVGLTGKLKPGERVRVDLSENDPWTNAVPPQPRPQLARTERTSKGAAPPQAARSFRKSH